MTPYTDDRTGLRDYHAPIAHPDLTGLVVVIGIVAWSIGVLCGIVAMGFR